MAKIRDAEVESFNKMKDALGEVDTFRKKVADRDVLISSLQAKSLELEELKKRDIDRVERERAALRRELEGLKAECDKLVHEKKDIEQALKEFDFMVTSEKEATLRVTETIKKADRIKKDGKDSILVVDDETDITDVFKRVMKNTFNIYTADSGKKALNVLEENPDICLIVTDQRMPEMTGTEFAAQVREKHADLPIFLLTGYADLTVAIDAMNKGSIIKYFDKPVDWVALESAIEVAIEMYDLTFAQKEILEDKKAFIVDKIRDLSVEVKTLGYNNVKMTDEIGLLKSDNHKLGLEVKKLGAENGELRGSVAQERKAMREEMARERETLEEELARKKDEAERVVEVQKERNKAELQKVQDAFEEEKQHALREIERLKAEFEESRKARLVDFEQERKRAEAALEEFRLQQAMEKTAIEKSMAEEKQHALREIKRLNAEFEADRKRVEEELALKKEEAGRAIELQKERSRAELEALQAALKEEQEQANWWKGELARKKEEAESAIELQKERNKAELEALQVAFKEEQERAAWWEIERLKTELNKDRQAQVSEVEADRKQMEQEFERIRAEMTEEREQLERRVLEQREKAESEVQSIRESTTKEREKLTKELEATLVEMKKAAADEVKELKASASRNLDLLKAAAEKKERELSEALTQSRRMAGETEERLKLTEGRIGGLESEIVKKINEKELILQELESVKADFKVAIQSQEALLAELAEVRSRLK